jgi:pimeloyl-ACP methyl ester carboxylesterase
MSTDTTTVKGVRTREPRRRRISAGTRVVGASLVAGAATALVLSLVVFPGATEGVITGSMLVGFGIGWALMATFSTRLTDQPQRWAAVPAVAMTGTGLCLMVTTPTNDTLTSLTWVWPPALLALVVWMAVQARRGLTGRGRWLLTPVFVFLAVASVGAVAQNVTTNRNQDAHPAPGTTYSVGDHRLHLDCRGESGPTVVLFNGLGEISDSWAKVTAELGSDTRVCAYDRAGQAWSDDVASPQDGIAAAADLHALLDAAGEQGPFVLVGHSIGGPYAMTYAAQFPDQVAGMVLLDSSSPRQLTDIPSYPAQYAVMRRGYAVLPGLARMGAGGLVAAGSGYPAEVADRLHAMTSTPRAARNARDEITTVPRLFEQAQALTTLGDLPLVVFTASEQLGTDGWAAAQDELAELSTNRAHRKVDSSHQGLVDDNEAAAESARAIDAVVAAVRDARAIADSALE